jgi:hypothetical protein
MKDVSLVSVISKHMDEIIDVLDLNIESEPSNYFVVMRFFKPHLESLASKFKVPCCASYVSVPHEAKVSAMLLKEMGFLSEYTNSYSPTVEGAQLFEAYHKQFTPDYKTRAELTKMLLDLSNHLD